MREIRQSGSEGGGTLIRSPYPYPRGSSLYFAKLLGSCPLVANSLPLSPQSLTRLVAWVNIGVVPARAIEGRRRKVEVQS